MRNLPARGVLVPIALLILASCAGTAGSVVDGAGATPPSTARPNVTTQAPAARATAPTTLSITVTRAAYGFVSARTAPGASCSVTARLPSGRTSTAQGLDAHSADANGNISWSYRTASNTTRGTGTYTIRCSSGGQSLTTTAPFSVP